ncbi:hypothetical protein L1049_005284 [Liquidambar formosana]|uniref:pectinesterase n=1 Tax=Liquidambar formosana TaxID=63359 RepID=A0AAP0WXJ3_LIQFO
MSPKLISCLFSISLFILLPFYAFPSFADISPTTSVSSDTICHYTPDPYYCSTRLPHNQYATVYEFGQHSVRASLSASSNFFSLVDKYLNTPSSPLSNTAIGALQDCKFLAGLNVDFLSSSFQTVNSTSQILPSMQADDVQTLLSAILTNQQTCLDGLQFTASASSVTNGLSSPLSDGFKLYSMSLALFTKGWVPEKNKGTWQPGRNHVTFRNGRLPLKMSSRNLAIYESVSRRKLLQSGDEQDGSGNFTTINDAVAAAPSNTNASNGYFLIYITAGVYAEYVSIPKNKGYLMMIGDGINQTIITGNRSVADGWTTFNSSTFGRNSSLGILPAIYH